MYALIAIKAVSIYKLVLELEEKNIDKDIILYIILGTVRGRRCFFVCADRPGVRDYGKYFYNYV